MNSLRDAETLKDPPKYRDPLETLKMEDLSAKPNFSTIYVSTGVALHASFSPEQVESVKKDLADPQKRWMRITDTDGAERWIAIAHITEMKFAIPDPT